jgi:hypothetical protein
MKITTKYTANPRTGAGRLVAKCGRNQLSSPYEHAFSPAQNHAHAAARLASRLELSGFWYASCITFREFYCEDERTDTCETEPAFYVGNADSVLPFSVKVFK